MKVTLDSNIEIFEIYILLLSINLITGEYEKIYKYFFEICRIKKVFDLNWEYCFNNCFPPQPFWLSTQR